MLGEACNLGFVTGTCPRQDEYVRRIGSFPGAGGLPEKDWESSGTISQTVKGAAEWQPGPPRPDGLWRDRLFHMKAIRVPQT